MKPLFVALAFVVSMAPAWCAAQQLYRCGNVYSQTPCAADAAPARISAGAAPEAAPGVAGSQLCATEGVARLSVADPESTRISAVRKAGTEVIQYAGKSVAARRYDVVLNTKGVNGIYQGDRTAACYLSEDERRVLKMDGLR